MRKSCFPNALGAALRGSWRTARILPIGRRAQRMGQDEDRSMQAGEPVAQRALCKSPTYRRAFLYAAFGFGVNDAHRIWNAAFALIS
jgi:hypothetical protein